MRTARIETQLDVPLSPDNSCSVLWHVPEADAQELTSAMNAVAGLAEMPAWGFVGMWEGSRLLESRAADIARSSRLTGQYSVGDTRMKGDILAMLPVEGDWFWTQFGAKISPHQICAAFVPFGAPVLAGWTHAGLQLVLTAAARQARPGASHRYLLSALEQAFLAEVLVAGGIAFTRLRAELVGPGIALTAVKDVIEKVSSELAGMQPVDSQLVERSRLLSGDW